MPKKILIVTDFFEPHISGIVTYIKQHIEAYKELNYSVTILTTLHKNSLKKEEIINSVRIIRCKPTIKISRGFYSFELIYKYFKLHKEFDFINIFFPLTEIFPIFLKFDNKTLFTYCCLPPSFLYNRFSSLYFYLFGLISLFFPKKIITLSNDYFRNTFLHKFFDKKVIEIPPYILKKNIKKNLNINKQFNIGYLGRICEEKGLEILIRASEILNSNHLNYKLLIAGDLNDKRFYNYIKHIKNKSKDNKNIIFMGKINEIEKDNFLTSLDVLVLPSVNSFEAFGIVQLEAMNNGVPVVASNIKGVRSIIKNTQNGYLFEKNNFKELANILLKIQKYKIKDPQLISNSVNKNYSYEMFTKKITLQIRDN